jgi:hypothetical protein
MTLLDCLACIRHRCEPRIKITLNEPGQTFVTGYLISYSEQELIVKTDSNYKLTVSVSDIDRIELVWHGSMLTDAGMGELDGTGFEESYRGMANISVTYRHLITRAPDGGWNEKQIEPSQEIEQ